MSVLVIILVMVARILPAPVSVQEQGGSFQLTDKTRSKIEYKLDPKCGLPAEGYTLNVTRTRVRAVASTPAGLFYAKQTLRQLEKDGQIPCVKIKDYPRYSWRGFHVDPCRHFQSVEDLKTMIDVMAQYKINVFHWHLTDDQGWRIEIKKYPRLTSVGAWRTEWDGGVHGGYYTQEEIKEVVAYAAERFIAVVPEIEMPGHAVAAVRAYPELSCTEEPVGSFSTWGSPNIVLCPGKEKMFEFLDDVIAEVVELFPGEYIHIGGDECKKDRWEKCPACQARIKAEGLTATADATAEERLQSYAVKRMEDILAKYGKKLIGWDEILEGGLSPNATVMSWRGEKGGIAAAEQGHEVIMCPQKDGMYLDHYQGDLKIEPETISGYNTLEKVYNYNPSIPVKGVQGNLWSEYIYSEAQRQYMFFPRAFAIAEIAWSQPENKDFTAFCTAVDRACEDLDSRGVNYHIPMPEQPGGSYNHVVFLDKATVEFTTTRPMKMVYTLDGSEPTPASAIYEKPFEFTSNAILKIACATSYGKLGPVRTLNIEKQKLIPATQMEEEPEHGLLLRTTYGFFLDVKDIPSSAQWTAWRPIESFREVPSQEPTHYNMTGMNFYAAEATGYIKLSRADVYVFSTVFDQLWIDGVKVVDNGSDVKKHSRHDGSIALEKGLHSVKVVFLSNVHGGWTTARNRGEVLYRRVGEQDFHTLRTDKLYKPL